MRRITMDTVIARNEGSIFYYGMLSSRTSESLEEYSSEQSISDDSKKVLTEAINLINDIFLVQDITSYDSDNCSTPTEKSLNVFGCVLDLIIDHQEDFKVHNSRDLVNLFRTIYSTVDEIKESSKNDISEEDLIKTKLFFSQLARLMLTHLSSSEEPKIEEIKNEL